MAKTKETYQKVAETFKKKGDRAWAEAKNGEDHKYSSARSYYGTAEKAKKKADSM